jgi:hypothetical protein
MADKVSPGVPTTGAPGDFAYDKFSRITENPQIATMPTNQREWGVFVRELEKMVRNESSAFVPTFQGFSSDPTDPFVWYQRYGQVVFMQFHFTTGTSNGTSFFIDNLPESITPSTTQLITPIYGLINNGSEVIGSIRVKTNNTVVFSSDPLQSSNWATIGDKGLNTTPTMNDNLSITYFLREPNKI